MLTLASVGQAPSVSEQQLQRGDLAQLSAFGHSGFLLHSSVSFYSPGNGLHLLFQHFLIHLLEMGELVPDGLRDGPVLGIP